jgi:hypothetical protein
MDSLLLLKDQTETLPGQDDRFQSQRQVQSAQPLGKAAAVSRHRTYFRIQRRAIDGMQSPIQIRLALTALLPRSCEDMSDFCDGVGNLQQPCTIARPTKRRNSLQRALW